MTSRILIIGGYGNFGSFIARRLACEENLVVIVAGRSADKAQACAHMLKTEWATLDINYNLDESLRKIDPDIVIHTSGPFQEQGYEVAQACIRQGCHYIDIADGRAFVAGITRLSEEARQSDILAVSGASSVPAFSAALIDYYQRRFETLHSVHYGISTAQKTSRGLATTRAVLGYAGKAFSTVQDGRMKKIYGWQGLHWRRFFGLGRRALGYCDIPDLELFPQRYPGLRTLRFYAGLELSFMHILLWLLAGCVRVGLIGNLQKAAPLLLALSRPFDRIGGDRSGFYMTLQGLESQGAACAVTFDLVARGGDGIYIPCVPAILMALKLARGEISCRGAFPCVGFLDRDEILGALQSLNILWEEHSG